MTYEECGAISASVLPCHEAADGELRWAKAIVVTNPVERDHAGNDLLKCRSRDCSGPGDSARRFLGLGRQLTG